MRNELFGYSELIEFSPIFRGKMGSLLSKLLLRITRISFLNKHYGELCSHKGVDFTTAWFERFGISYTIEHEDRLSELPEGGFITISNHPFGGIDGLILIDMIAKRHKDYKFMVNSMLLRVEPMKDHFIGVSPITPDSKGSVKNCGRIRETLSYLQSGGCVGFFPSGAVSGFFQKGFRITDREWQLSVIRLIKSANLPVLPIFIHGRNSGLFYLLGLIHWKLRNLLLPNEIVNKKGRNIRVSIGDLITTREINQVESISDLSHFLRAKTEM